MTPAAFETLRLVVEGRSKAEIAALLGISEEKVRIELEDLLAEIEEVSRERA